MSKRTVKQIDKEIMELKEKLQNVKGRETEIHTRIVGYYRPVSNFNKGKAEEYKNRITYNIDNIGDENNGK